jgi:hypothetical protein
MSKQLFTFAAFVCISFFGFTQVTTPKASPLCKMEQKVGLTDVTLSYSRPAVNGRVIFGDFIPYNAYWRLGANECTKITASDKLIFGKDTLKAGTYALFAKPNKNQWDLAFYSETNLWGMPEVWDEKKVVLTLTSNVFTSQEKSENLFIGIDEITNNGGVLVIQWDNTKVKFPFGVLSKDKVVASIQKTMAGPSANDYHAAAKYYLDEKMDMAQALDWVSKAIVLRPEAYWMLRTKSLILAEKGAYKEAIAAAEMCIQLAEKDGDSSYVTQSKKSIESWKNKK